MFYWRRKPKYPEVSKFFIINFRRYLKKIGMRSGAYLSVPVGPGKILVSYGILTPMVY
jgi:hypothetical protein